MKLYKICLIFIILILLFYGCENKKKKSKYGLKTESVSVAKDTLILKGVNFYNNKSGKLSWELNAKIARINKNKGIANLKNVLIKFKKENIKITSNQGIYYLKTKDGVVYDNVTVTSEAWKISTDKILIKNKKKLIEITAPFVLKGKNFYLKGRSIKIFLNEKIFFIRGRVESLWKK